MESNGGGSRQDGVGSRSPGAARGPYGFDEALLDKNNAYVVKDAPVASDDAWAPPRARERRWTRRQARVASTHVFLSADVPMRKCRSDGNDSCADLGESCSTATTKEGHSSTVRSTVQRFGSQQAGPGYQRPEADDADPLAVVGRHGREPSSRGAPARFCQKMRRDLLLPLIAAVAVVGAWSSWGLAWQPGGTPQRRTGSSGHCVLFLKLSRQILGLGLWPPSRVWRRISH